MFNLGFSEILIVGIIALIFIGPKELPDIARVIGRMLNELKRATGDLSTTLLNPKQQFEDELRKSLQTIKDDILDPNHKGDVSPEVEPISPPLEDTKKDESNS